MFNIGDLVKVNEDSLWYDNTRGLIGTIVSAINDIYGVDFGVDTVHTHNLDRTISTNTGLYIFKSDVILCKKKGGNYNEY